MTFMKAINRDILKLAVPSILANITVPIVGMVDIAVAGHLDGAVATMIGGIAIGTMLFDLLYWNFGFLRVGTGGLTAQAFGKEDRKECAIILTRALGISLSCALILIAIQWIFVKAAFMVVDCTPEVRELASQYFYIRIWAAPATLSLMAFKGWFIGMQDSVSPMVTDFVVNGMNVLMSIVLALGIPLGSGAADLLSPGVSEPLATEATRTWLIRPMGFYGIAAGTVVAQYSGLLTSLILLAFKYVRSTFAGLSAKDLKETFRGSETRRFFVMNTDLFVRSLCFIAIYIGFTTISARYGDLLLAVSSILMKLLMIFSYFTDGFAYAGEALTGKYIGANNRPALHQMIHQLFVWGIGLSLAFTLMYGLGGEDFLKLLTNETSVIAASSTYFYWVLAIPLAGFAAFLYDGIFIGATATHLMLRAMAIASGSFFLIYFGCREAIGNHALWLAFIAYLTLRGIVQGILGRKILR